MISTTTTTTTTPPPTMGRPQGAGEHPASAFDLSIRANLARSASSASFASNEGIRAQKARRNMTSTKNYRFLLICTGIVMEFSWIFNRYSCFSEFWGSVWYVLLRISRIFLNKKAYEIMVVRIVLSPASSL